MTIAARIFPALTEALVSVESLVHSTSKSQTSTTLVTASP